MTNNTTEVFNITAEMSNDCNITINPWCDEFVALQVFEISYLSIIVVSGVLGNLLVVSSITYVKKVHQHGNEFIISLAIADFIATGIYTPSVIANVIKEGMALPLVVCQAYGYLSIIACVSSMWNLAFISLNRFWEVVHNNSYTKAFSRLNIYIMIAFAWLWPSLLAVPTVTGWSGLEFDYKSVLCTWNDDLSLSYSIVLMAGGILVPLGCTIFCYWKLYWYVRDKSKNLSKHYRRREISLLKTLATTVLVFVLCWTPYSLVVLFDAKNITPQGKKVVTWLGLTNSALNFIIYGVMNQGFRKGYKDFLSYMFSCNMYYKKCVFIREKQLTKGICSGAEVITTTS